MNEQYNATKTTEILRNVTEMIGARILNIAVQDYDHSGLRHGHDLLVEGALSGKQVKQSLFGAIQRLFG